jgi:hypothetical protein
MRHGRDGLARDSREQQKKSQLRNVERIGNVKAEFGRKEEIRRHQAAGKRRQHGESAAVVHRDHDRRQ